MAYLHCGEHCIQRVQDVEWDLLLFDGMQLHQLEPNVITYTAVVSAVERADAEEALQLFDEIPQ